jgi:hypothetical protein
MTGRTYEVEVVGSIDQDLLSRLRAEIGDLSVATEPAGTLIVASGADQAALLGLIDRVHDLGLDIREVRLLAEPEIDGVADSPRDPVSSPYETG